MIYSKTLTKGAIVRNIILTLVVFVVSATSISAQTVPDEFKGLNFHKYTTDNFEILSIDDKQGTILHKNVEKIKNWIFDRWNISNVDFSRRCMIICTPTDEMFKKFFRKMDIDPRYDKETSAIWISLDEKTKGNWLKTVVAEKMTFICLHEWSKKYDIKIDPWVFYGMSVMNTPPENIRKIILSKELVSKNGSYTNEAMDVDSLLQIKFDDIKYKTLEERNVVKAQCAAMILLFKRELSGKDKFEKFIAAKSIEEGVKVYGFKNVSHLNSVYKNYLYNLSYDLRVGRTPKSYLTIFK